VFTTGLKVTASASCLGNGEVTCIQRHGGFSFSAAFLFESNYLIRSEYRQILSQLETEMVDGVMFRDLSLAGWYLLAFFFF